MFTHETWNAEDPLPW